MKIYFERSGGFAGLRMTASLDTGLMSDEDAQHIEELVASSDFFALPDVFSLPEKGADYFQYKLTIESKGKKHTVEVSEISLPEGLRPLIKKLTEKAHKK